MIQVNGLKKAFDGFVALNGVDMHVEREPSTVWSDRTEQESPHSSAT